jgi:succinyl-CoA synthetase beta subunit
MDLLEYQAKQLFQAVGIPTLPSQTFSDPSQIKHLTLPYPVVLKSQVRLGGRGKLGGVRFVENTIDAIAAAHTIFHLPILGTYPEVILAEARYAAQEELCLAVVLDYYLQKPVLMGSVSGGMDVDRLLQNLEKVVVEREFSPYIARQLAIKMGLHGTLLNAVSDILEKMYLLFASKDLEIIEINPLGVDDHGQVMALDGKIAVNNYAIARHPDLVAFCTPKTPSRLKWLRKTPPLGNVAIIADSQGVALASWDELCQKDLQPACCLLLEESKPRQEVAENLVQGLEQILNLENIKVIFLNLVGNPPLVEMLLQTLARCLQPYSCPAVSSLGEDRILRATRSRNPNPSQPDTEIIPEIALVIRCAHGNPSQLNHSLGSWSIAWVDSLTAAVDKIAHL